MLPPTKSAKTIQVKEWQIMDLQLEGKRAIVTGGSRGIGKAVARNLLQEGVRVALLARSQDDLDVAAAELSGLGGAVMTVAADTTDSDSAVNAVRRVVADWGGIDILVNGAARTAAAQAPSTISTFDENTFLADMDTKVLGYIRMIKAVAPYMIESGWGRVINISGRNALVTGSMTGSVRNVAVAALTKNLADELGAQGITVTAVHPGFTRTEATEGVLQARATSVGLDTSYIESQLADKNSSRRLITSEEVAHLITFLASPLSSAVSGGSIEAGGGVRGFINY